LLILSSITSSQTFSGSSLPIVLISIGDIPDDPRVVATMKIIFRGEGQRNYLADQNNPAYLNYNGLIEIERRGRSTQEYGGKQQYGFSTKNSDLTNNNVSLLGMPSEHDWILNGMVFDRALIRDFLAFNLSRKIGEYAPRSVYCEVSFNGGPLGLYLLTEKIKADDNRVNIIKIEANDVYLPELSGGYIIKADLELPFGWEMPSYGGSPVLYHHYFPKPEDIIAAQHTYIYSQFKNLDSFAIKDNASVSNGFPSVIDIPSFIHFMIIQELSLNKDAYDNSTFFHKDRNGKLRAGPVWDFDQAFGSGVFYDEYGWHVGEDQLETDGLRLIVDSNGSRFWKALFDNPQFRCYFSKTWNELIKPGQPLNFAVIKTFIDQTVSTINEAAIREYALWDYRDSFQKRILHIENFLKERIIGITNHLGPYSSCSNVEVPPLVITKIMYHPETSIDFSDSDDLEFIEITNNGDYTVDLTGIYFGGTGLVYQFPAYSTLEPHKSVVLASNSDSFQLKYGFTPCSQFTRHLSNKSENLLLLDAFGNIIDNVNYCDSVPWPDADGNGYYLDLIDANLDNSVTGNWITSNSALSFEDYVSSTENYIFIESDLQLFPNPVNDILKIKATYIIKLISLYDSYGRLLETININSEVYDLNMNQYLKGFYILRIISPGKSQTVKIVKNE